MPRRRVLLLLVVVAELVLLDRTVHWLGVGRTLGLLALDTVLGLVVLRRQGRRALGALRAAATQRRPPGPELADSAVVAAGGVLLLAPGFLSDLPALLCLLPPTRGVARRLLVASVLPRRVRARSRTGGGVVVVEPGALEPGRDQEL